MSILSTSDLGLSFGAFDVFHGVSVRIAGDSKIGLIGPNGIGKTSLLLILAGLSQPTSGSMQIARGRRLGYLRQESVDAFAARENTVYAEMLTVFAHLQAQQERLHEMEREMSAGHYTDALLEAYGALQETFEDAGGYDYDTRIRKTLQGLGLGERYWQVPLCQLSGGQQTRALLARLLLEKPDLLFLDEPTNHLDAEAVEWLERTLREWDGAILLVSHDRYFLDAVVNTIWEMSRNGMEVYHGNYSAYLNQRQERWERKQQVYIEEKARLQKELEFIQRNIARASTNARAVGLLRRLSRDLAIVDAFGVMGLRHSTGWGELGLHHDRPMGVADAARFINNLPEPNHRPPQLNMRLNIAQRSGTIVMSAKDLQIGYPRNSLFVAPEIELKRGECVALIGPNGSGKSTFLKNLLGYQSPLAGQIKLGASLKIGYFAQAHEDLAPQNTVLEELLRRKPMPESLARNHLAQYLFRGEDVFKPIGALSGGERGRLALAILALEGANFLLLDEPTNHLDIPAQECLQEVLEHFAGTILLVSHDRYLVDRLATQIWELRDGQLFVFKGTYREFIASREAISRQPGTDTGPVASSKMPVKSRRDGKKAPGRARDLDDLEARITRQEAAINRLEREMQTSDASQSFERLRELSWKYVEAQADLEQLTAEWEEIVA